MQRERVARNVCTLVEPPTVTKTEIEPLTIAEAHRILDAAASRRNPARWSVALALGMRQGETLGLLWQDVDLDAGTLTVRRTLERRTWEHGCPETAPCDQPPARCPNRAGGGWFLSEPKSRAGRRAIAAPQPLVAAMRAQKTAQAKERLLAGSMWHDEGFVFATPDGRPIQANRDWKEWKSLLAAAGVRDARLHDARHTAATLLLSQGVHPRVAMQILGHSQISLTMNTYTHVMPEIAREATDLVGDALWGPRAPDGHRNGTGVVP